MENDAAPSPIQPPPSSKKKKSKKEKKRKLDEEVANGSTSSSGKKKKKKNKRKKEEQVNDNNGSVDNNSGPSSPEQQQQDASQTINSQEQSPPPTPAQIQRSISSQKSQQQPTTTTTSDGPTGSIFNLSSAADPSSSSSSNNNKSSPYQMKTIQGSVALLPTSLPNVTKCIQSLLHSLLLMYDANMGGVLLSLDEEQGVKLLPIDIRRGNNTTRGSGNNNSSSLIGGRIVDDLPYIHYRFQVKGLLFCPILGRKLKGQVVECTPTYVTLTTHHILSTKISTEKLQEQGFFYNSVTLEWTRERDVGGGVGGGGSDDDFLVGPSTSIYLDDIVEFVVERIHECGGYISLDGTQPSVSTLG
ncbi:hypothetical protein ACHAXR_011724 [Thalassiosira sp. AJA248-18]